MSQAKFILTFVGGVVLAAAVGGILFTAHLAKDAAANKESRALEPALLALRAENRQLREETGRLKTDAAEHSALARVERAVDAKKADPTAARLQLLAELQKRHLASMSVQILDRGKLTDQFSELFGLAAEQRSALQSDLDQVRDRITQLQIKNARVTKNANGAVVVEISPLAESPQIFDEVSDAFARALGPERNAAFLTLGENYLANSYNHFGAEKHSITILPYPGSINGPIYEVIDENRTPTSSGSSKGQVNREQMAESYPLAAGLLPPDF